jgi:hypothetical protein
MTYTLEQQKQNRKLWIEALRSGKYQQTKSQLTDRMGHCCLGVACIVAGKTNREIEDDNNLDNFPEVMDFFGLRYPEGEYGGYPEVDGSSLVCHNDDDDNTFDEIANIIESEPPGLFIESEAP